MARIQHDLTFWQEELHYIARAWPNDKASYRADESVFNDYIEMQATFCEEDGFPDLAFHMRGFKEFVPHSKRK